jgi:hypothetical protein
MSYNRPEKKRCSICHRPIDKIDEESPMLRTAIYEFVLDNYNIVNIQNKTFICAECIERALNRPIKLDDLNDSQWNIPFMVKKYHLTKEMAGYIQSIRYTPCRNLRDDLNCDYYPIIKDGKTVGIELKNI